MKNLEVILSLSCTVLGLLITAAAFILKFFSSAKAKKIADGIIKISSAVLPFIREAEKLVSYSGTEKKAYVMTKAKEFALANHISFDEKELSQKVEELVALTKEVNFKTKAKEKKV